MKRSRLFLPLALLAFVWFAAAGYVWFTASELPARVATHFDLRGTPNGWMTRAQHMCFMLIFSAAIPAFVIGIFTWMRSFGGVGLNIPHKDYWLAAERQQATFDFLQRQGFWFAGMFIAFLVGMHHVTLRANTRSPVQLPAAEVAWVSGLFTAGTVVWLALVFGRFFRKPA